MPTTIVGNKINTGILNSDISSHFNHISSQDASINHLVLQNIDLYNDNIINFKDVSINNLKSDKIKVKDLDIDGSFNVNNLIYNNTYVNKEVQISTSIDISNSGTGPALSVTQYGDNDDNQVAIFNAGEQGDSMIIDYAGNINLIGDTTSKKLNITREFNMESINGFLAYKNYSAGITNPIITSDGKLLIFKTWDNRIIINNIYGDTQTIERITLSNGDSGNLQFRTHGSSAHSCITVTNDMSLLFTAFKPSNGTKYIIAMNYNEGSTTKPYYDNSIINNFFFTIYNLNTEFSLSLSDSVLNENNESFGHNIISKGEYLLIICGTLCFICKINTDKISNVKFDECRYLEFNNDAATVTPTNFPTIADISIDGNTIIINRKDVTLLNELYHYNGTTYIKDTTYNSSIDNAMPYLSNTKISDDGKTIVYNSYTNGQSDVLYYTDGQVDTIYIKKKIDNTWIDNTINLTLNYHTNGWILNMKKVDVSEDGERVFIEGVTGTTTNNYIYSYNYQSNNWDLTKIVNNNAIIEHYDVSNVYSNIYYSNNFLLRFVYQFDTGTSYTQFFLYRVPPDKFHCEAPAKFTSLVSITDELNINGNTIIQGNTNVDGTNTFKNNTTFNDITKFYGTTEIYNNLKLSSCNIDNVNIDGEVPYLKIKDISVNELNINYTAILEQDISTIGTPDFCDINNDGSVMVIVYKQIRNKIYFHKNDTTHEQIIPSNYTEITNLVTGGTFGGLGQSLCLNFDGSILAYSIEDSTNRYIILYNTSNYNYNLIKYDGNHDLNDKYGFGFYIDMKDDFLCVTSYSVTRIYDLSNLTFNNTIIDLQYDDLTDYINDTSNFSNLYNNDYMLRGVISNNGKTLCIRSHNDIYILNKDIVWDRYLLNSSTVQSGNVLNTSLSITSDGKIVVANYDSNTYGKLSIFYNTNDTWTTVTYNDNDLKTLAGGNGTYITPDGSKIIVATYPKRSVDIYSFTDYELILKESKSIDAHDSLISTYRGIRAQNNYFAIIPANGQGSSRSFNIEPGNFTSNTNVLINEKLDVKKNITSRNLNTNNINCTDISCNDINFNIVTGVSVYCDNLDVIGEISANDVSINNLNVKKLYANEIIVVNDGESPNDNVINNDISYANIGIENNLYVKAHSSLVDISCNNISNNHLYSDGNSFLNNVKIDILNSHETYLHGNTTIYDQLNFTGQLDVASISTDLVNFQDLVFKNNNNTLMNLYKNLDITTLEIKGTGSRIRTVNQNGNYWDLESLLNNEMQIKYNDTEIFTINQASFWNSAENATKNLENTPASLILRNPTSGYLGAHAGKYIQWTGNFHNGGSYNTFFMPVLKDSTTSGMILYDDVTTDFRVSIGQSELSAYNFFVNGSSGGNSGWSTASDDRIKFNEENIEGLKIIRQLNPKKYDKIIKFDTSPPSDIEFNNNLDKYPNIKEAGIIAQDLLNTDISFVVTNKDISDSSFTPMSVDYNSVFTYAIQSIKELDNKINKLESDNLLLLNRISELENRN